MSSVEARAYRDARKRPKKVILFFEYNNFCRQALCLMKTFWSRRNKIPKINTLRLPLEIHNAYIFRKILILKWRGSTFLSKRNRQITMMAYLDENLFVANIIFYFIFCFNKLNLIDYSCQTFFNAQQSHYPQICITSYQGCSGSGLKPPSIQCIFWDFPYQQAKIRSGRNIGDTKRKSAQRKPALVNRVAFVEAPNNTLIDSALNILFTFSPFKNPRMNKLRAKSRAQQARFTPLP